MINQNKEINYSKIADKETQNLILEKLNASGGEDNSEVINNINSTTLNTNEKITGLDTNLTQVSKSISGDGSTNTGYGTGVMGDITYNASTTVWPSLDVYGRYIWNCTNFTLPEGVTMIPPEKNNGLYIYCTDTCTINGTIDMRNKRLTLDSSNGISNFVLINGVKYLLAKGGNTVKGGNGGGSANWDGCGSPNSTNNYASSRHLGGKALDQTKAGNINGGGLSSYGTAATPFGNGGEIHFQHYGDGSSNYAKGNVGGIIWNTIAPGAIALISKNINIGTNGILNCTAKEGFNSTGATDGSVGYKPSYSSGVWVHSGIKHGFSGNGASAPSGGGPITIITENFTNNGKLLTSGGYLNSPQLANGTTTILANGSHYSCGLGGEAGQGGIYISEAGEIKVYIVGGAN